MGAEDSLNDYQFQHERIYEINNPISKISVTAWKNGDYAGKLIAESTGEGINVGVGPIHQNKGIGSRMWEIAEAENPEVVFKHDDLTRAGYGLANSRKRKNPERHEMAVTEPPPPRNCTGHVTSDGGLQHDGPSCPVHEP
jgi:hypothetical protein